MCKQFVRVKKLRKRLTPTSPCTFTSPTSHTVRVLHPATQDYGVALKGNNFGSLLQCYDRLLLFFLSCRSKGAWDYYRSMLVCRLLMQHWIKEDLPVAQLLQANHTVFSEESGEIALSVLVHSQPPNTHTELTTTRNYWQLTHQRYTALRSGLDLPRHKKHRVIGTNLSFFLSCSFSLPDFTRARCQKLWFCR